MNSPTEKTEFEFPIDEMTTGFVGREFVFDAIGEFFSDNRSGYFVIQGEPGVGKTAALAEFVKRTGCLAHFNIRAAGINRPSQFIDSICSQLHARFELGDELTDVSKDDLGARLQMFLDATRAKLDDDKRLIIAVDAIDEVDSSIQTRGSNVLYLPSTLAQNVFFILTYRKMHLADLPLRVTCPMYSLDLSACTEQSAADVDAYLKKAAERPKIRNWLSAQKLTVEEFVSRLSAKSELNFMYLHCALAAIEADKYHDLSSDQLPTSLQGYYEDQWRRMGMTASPLPIDKIRLLYVLSEVREPISPQLIAEFADLDPLVVQAVINEWRQFLAVEERAGQRLYSLFHRTFRDFLHRKDIVDASDIAIESVNRAIADNLWQEVMGDG